MHLSFKRYEFGSICVEYLFDDKTGQVALVLLPKGKKSVFEKRREWLNIPELVELDMDGKAWAVGNLCHLSLGNFSQSKGAGGTLKHGFATKALKYDTQSVIEEEDKTTILTVLKAEEGYRVNHSLVNYHGEEGFETTTEFVNESEEEMILDLLTSVSLDNLNPFDRADNQDNLVLHRFYGGWSIEGKHRKDTMEELNLERSWMCAFPESEKFGSVGSYPVQRYFPMAVLEEKKNQVYWGIQLESPSSWQMEVSRDGDCYSFSAGIADVEFGSWSKIVSPGECFIAPKAYISVAGKSMDQVCSRIINMHHKYVDTQPGSEHTLPIIFNDWCASYGEPSHEKTLAYAEKLSGCPVKYIVVDAGWTETKEKSFGQGGNGDWEYSKRKFPRGLIETSRALKEKGFILGIWFEIEVTTVGAKVYEKSYDDRHLTRNHHVINTGGERTFWDFRDERVIAYLSHKVIDFLKENEIGYLKIDYNSSIGIGCDGAESLGEGLRQQMLAVQDFLCKIRREIPELVIENCASGGHRLEASFMNLTSMSSFSDAHECAELPCVAANLQRLVLTRQNQIWVVLNERLSFQEIYYRLASGFLGRFCLSGNIEGLSAAKWDAAETAMEFYESITEILKYSGVKVHRSGYTNTRHPKGIQIVERQAGDEILLVIHSFEEAKDYELELPYAEEKKWTVVKCLGLNCGRIQMDGSLKITGMKDWEGMVLLLRSEFGS